MASSTRPSPELGMDVAVTPGASLPPFRTMPFPPPIPGPQHWPPWEQHLPPSMTPSFPPGGTQLLPAFPRTPLVPNAGYGPSAPGACNIIVQVRSEGRPAEHPQTQTFVLTQAPLNWSTPGPLSRSTACPVPLFLTTPAMETIVTAPAVGVAQSGKGSWTPGFPPQAPLPAAQLAPIIPQVNLGPQLHGISREGSLATNQSKASQDDSCNPKSVYENFRRWQRFKSLARRHLPQSPDAEALSCFLIPVLRSLARLKPTMTLEEGLWRAVQEWQHRSNFDRMIYYEMARKFMEFEAEEVMQIQKLQWMQGVQGLPPPVPPKLDPQGSSAPTVCPQPGTHVPTGVPSKGDMGQGMTAGPIPSPSFPLSCSASASAPRKAGPRAHPTRSQPHRAQRHPGTKAPKEIPPEAVREYVNIMEVLVGPIHLATGKSEAECGKDEDELKQEEDGTYADPDLLSYIDKLCSQEEFVTKVEAVIHPRFLADLLSPEPQLDPLALAEELEQEEGLTPEELVQKRLLALKEDKGVRTPSSQSVPQVDSSPSESDASKDAQRYDQGPQLGVRHEAGPPEVDFEAVHRFSQANTGLSKAKDLVPSLGQQELPPFQPGQPSPPQGQRCTGPQPGPRDTSVLRTVFPILGARGPRDGSSEDEEELPSLAFLLASQHSLLPWRLSQSPVPASGQAPSSQRIGLSPAPLGAGLGVSETPALALGLVRSSQLRKRKCDPFVTGRKRKRLCSQ
uniref:Nuclear Testis protein N-terminal domain-containing protein n=2 Tax=Bos TaxID=9903 RepID=F1MC09_BOVIN